MLDLGTQEADALDDAQIASHHLLLGLLREGEGLV
ncbi:MAG: Clp protease N-terminal domain-containing protein [Solirubrobacterales bacterium]